MKPMLFCNTEWEWKDLPNPMFLQPKLDGIYVTKVNGNPETRQQKPVPNLHVRELLKSHMKNGMIGEFMLLDPNAKFQDVTSAFMSRDGEPEFMIMLFDWWSKNKLAPYYQRYNRLVEWHSEFKYPGLLSVVSGHRVTEKHEFNEIEKKYMYLPGCEGLIIRDLYGLYKQGRCTKAERNVFKHVFMRAGIATCQEIIGNKTYPDRAGAIMAYSKQYGAFKVGSGFTEADLKEMHNYPERFKSRQFAYKYKRDSVKHKPRQPIFIQWKQ